MKVALYARVSTDDKGQTTENQFIKLRAIAKARGDQIIGEYFDYRSGKDTRRDGLRALLVDAKLHLFDKVMITKLDRMMRSTKNMLNVLQDLEGWGVGLECSDQDIDTKSPAGRLLLTVLAAIAEFERELCSSRVKDGMARAKAEGKHIGHKSGQKNIKKRVSKKPTPLYLTPEQRAACCVQPNEKEILYRPSEGAK
jgi:DNA invertase Pin-like site-specific DNA recombinase